MRPLERVLLVRTNPWTVRQGASPPIGCLYLAAAIRHWLHPGIQIRVVDMRAQKLTHRGLMDVVRAYDPDVVGLSSLSCEHEALLQIAQSCKSWKPECLTVVGGPHASMFGDLLAPDPNLDVVVRGEGERTFVELLQAWADQEPFDTVAGLLFKNGAEVVQTAPRPLEANLDALPPAAWDLLDFNAYATENNFNGHLAASPYMSVMTTRGCPYQCVYCHRLFGMKMRERSVAQVTEELELLRHRYGVREIHLIDDCFNLNRRRAMEICDEIVARDLRFKIAFPNGVRGDRMDDELIDKLKQAGTYSITYAVETASERLQKLIKKNLNVVKTLAAIDYTYEAGIIPAAFFMFGFPTETRGEMERTLRVACESKALKAYFFSVVPFPRTELFDLARRMYPGAAISPPDDASAYGYWAPKPFYERVSGIDMEALQRRAYRQFYFDPVRVARILARFPKNTHLLRGVFYGLRASFKAVDCLHRRLPVQV